MVKLLIFFSFLATAIYALPASNSSISITSSGSGGQSNNNEWQAAWGNLQSAFRNVGSWFTRQYQSVQGWFANSQQDMSVWFAGTQEELDTKVQDMVNFLGTVKQNANTIVEGAGQELRNSMQNVTKFYDDTIQFQNKLRSDASQNFQALQREWEQKVQNMYNGGLDKIVNAAETAKAGPPRGGANQPAATNTSAVTGRK